MSGKCDEAPAFLKADPVSLMWAGMVPAYAGHIDAGQFLNSSSTGEVTGGRESSSTAGSELESLSPL